MLYKELSNGGSAIFALVAAFFWFASAAAPRNDNTYFRNLGNSARMNRWAALFSGISAALSFFSYVAGR